MRSIFALDSVASLKRMSALLKDEKMLRAAWAEEGYEQGVKDGIEQGVEQARAEETQAAVPHDGAEVHGHAAAVVRTAAAIIRSGAIGAGWRVDHRVRNRGRTARPRK